MSDCPKYYRLADGTELTDFLADVLLLPYEGRLPVYVCHCIYAAMEHRYRRGRKTGQEQHDLAAERWWLDQARSQHAKNGTDPKVLELAIMYCCALIDCERKKYESA